jgi:O-antigen/teichoic acid export membrane protein
VPSPLLKPADRTRSILGNTAMVAASQVSGLLVGLLVTPYVLHTLGLARFGLWAFLSSLVAFTGFLSFGLARGSIRFIAFHSERNELNVAQGIVTYGVLWHLAALFALTPVAWLVGRALFPHLNIAPGLIATAETVFPLLLATSLLAATTRPLASLLMGLERMWITSSAAIVSQVVYAALVVVLLSQGAGLYSLLVASAAQVFVQAGIYYLTCKRILGSVFANPFALDPIVLKDLIRFGGWIQLTTLAGFVNDKADALVIGAWVNLQSVGSYAIGTRVAQLARIIPLTLLPPLFPAAASIHAQGDDERLRRTLLQSSRLVGFLSLGIGGFVVSASSLIVTLWLGRSYPDVVWITSVMVIAYMIHNLTGVGTTVISAIGKPRYESEYAVISMGLNIGGTVALAPFFGLKGIVGATAVAMAASSIFFLWRFHRLLHIPVWEYLGGWLWRVAASAGVASCGIYALIVSFSLDVDESRAGAAVSLLILTIVYALAFLLSLRVLKFFEPRDLLVMRRVLPGPARRLASLPAIEFLFGART